MKNKNVLIGSGLIILATVSYFYFKNKKRNDDVANAEKLIVDDSDVSESDISYLSSNGQNSVNIKKYLIYLKNNPTDSKRIFFDKQVFSLIDNLNVRNETVIEPSSLTGVVKNKYTYLGRISGTTLDENKELWFRLTPAKSNPKLKNIFNWGGRFNPFFRYVKATAVFAKI